jgi:hypothetical protein
VLTSYTMAPYTQHPTTTTKCRPQLSSPKSQKESRYGSVTGIIPGLFTQREAFIILDGYSALRKTGVRCPVVTDGYFAEFFLGWFLVVGGAFLQGDGDLHRCLSVVFSLVERGGWCTLAGSYEPRCWKANFFLGFEIYFCDLGDESAVLYASPGCPGIPASVSLPSHCPEVSTIRNRVNEDRSNAFTDLCQSIFSR